MSRPLRAALFALALLPVVLLLLVMGIALLVNSTTGAETGAAVWSADALQASADVPGPLAAGEADAERYARAGDARSRTSFYDARSHMDARLAALAALSRDGLAREQAQTVTTAAQKAFALLAQDVRGAGHGRGEKARLAPHDTREADARQAFAAALARFRAIETANRNIGLTRAAASYRRAFEFCLAGTVATLFVTLGLYLVVGRRLAKQFVHLEAETKALFEYDESPSLTIPGNDEFGRIDTSLRAVAYEVRRRQRALGEVNRLQRAILDSTEYAVISTGADGFITSFNRAAEQILAYPAERVVGHGRPEEFEASERGRDGVCGYTLAPDEALARRESTWLRASGASISMSCEITRLRDERGREIGLVGVSHPRDGEARAAFDFLRRLSDDPEPVLDALGVRPEYSVEGDASGERERQRTKITETAVALLAMLGTVLERPPTTNERPATPRDDARSGEADGVSVEPSRILVADDDKTNAAIVRILLARDGHTVTVVVNGVEAVDAVKNETFDLIFMDMQMPLMGGVEATNVIRKLAKPMRDIPIVALTANNMAFEIGLCLEAGMNGHLAKPIDREALRAAVRNVRGAGLNAAAR